MAEVFAPFIINGTFRSLTFYVMEGRNFVRKKSSLTRRKVLYAPCYKNTRHFAGLMGQASKIGSLVYKALPEYWRQSWMYRSFTGEAFRMLKKGKKAPEIQEELFQRYVAIVVGKQPEVSKAQADICAILCIEPKRAYRKQNSEYWQHKTRKSNRRKARKQQTLYYAGLMGRASKIGSRLYAELPRKYKRRSEYQFLTGLALKLLKEQMSEEDILAELLPTLPSDQFKEAPIVCEQQTITKKAAILRHPQGYYYFIPTPYKREYTPSIITFTTTGFRTTSITSFDDT